MTRTTSALGAYLMREVPARSAARYVHQLQKKATILGSKSSGIGQYPFGRSSEFWLVLRMALRSNPLILLGMWRTGWQLMRAGRLSLRQDRIRDVASLPRGLAPREVA